MKLRFVLLFMVSSLVLAGCATPDNGDAPPGVDVPTPESVSREEARAALASATGNLPPRFSVDMEIVVDERDPVKFRGLFDETDEVTFMELSGDLSFLGENASGPVDVPEGSGLTIYATGEGSVILLNRTAYAFPPSNDTSGGGQDGFAPSTDDAGDFVFDRDEFLSDIAGENASITSVNPTTYRGKAAVEIVVEHTAEEETSTSRVIVFLESERLAYVETRLPADEDDDGQDPFAGGTLRGDFYYEDEIGVEPSQQATRAMGLAYESDMNPFSFSRPTNMTWTFLNTAGVALGEVEVHLKASSGEGGSPYEEELTNMTTTFSMTLADGEGTSDDGVTFVFTDADGDGAVSAGDTLETSWPDEMDAPTLGLYDTVTETYVVPGPGLLALLAAAGALALARARRT